MQRAAASQPSQPSPLIPVSDFAPPSPRRQKLSQDQPLTPNHSIHDVSRLRSERTWKSWPGQGEETKWEFSFQEEDKATDGPFKVKVVVSSEVEAQKAISSGRVEPWRPSGEGRRSFGQFKRVEKVRFTV